jgi:hypothetical protein
VGDGIEWEFIFLSRTHGELGFIFGTWERVGSKLQVMDFGRC